MFRTDNVIGDFALSKWPRKPRQFAWVKGIQEEEATKISTVLDNKEERPKEKGREKWWKDL